MSKILSPLSSLFSHADLFCEAHRLSSQEELLSFSVDAPGERKSTYIVDGHAEHIVRITVHEHASSVLCFRYHAHEKETDLSVRIFVDVHRDASFSFDISAFLMGEHSKSDIRVFLVLRDGARSTVRQFTRAEGKTSIVHEEIRGLAFGEYANASFIPELALLHDDIVATHAASVVKIPDKRIAYLCARGYSEEGARQCFVDGFLQKEMSYGNIS